MVLSAPTILLNKQKEAGIGPFFKKKHKPHMPQCDLIGTFLKVLGKKILKKVAQIFGDVMMGCLKNITFK